MGKFWASHRAASSSLRLWLLGSPVCCLLTLTDWLRPAQAPILVSVGSREPAWGTFPSPEANTMH